MGRGGSGGVGIGTRAEDGCESASGKAWRGSRGAPAALPRPGRAHKPLASGSTPLAASAARAHWLGSAAPAVGANQNIPFGPCLIPWFGRGGWDKRPCA